MSGQVNIVELVFIVSTIFCHKLCLSASEHLSVGAVCKVVLKTGLF